MASPCTKTRGHPRSLCYPPGLQKDRNREDLAALDRWQLLGCWMKQQRAQMLRTRLGIKQIKPLVALLEAGTLQQINPFISFGFASIFTLSSLAPLPSILWPRFIAQSQQILPHVMSLPLISLQPLSPPLWLQGCICLLYGTELLPPLNPRMTGGEGFIKEPTSPSHSFIC